MNNWIPLVAVFAVCLASSLVAAQGPESTNCTQHGLSYCDKCYNPGVLCYECPSGYRLKDDKSECEACPQYCATCEVVSGADTCLSCLEGFGLSDGSCVQCDGDCVGCSTVDGQIQCASCKNPGASGKPTTLSADRSTCLDCPLNCLMCEGGENGEAGCTECVSGYVPKTSDKTCMICPNNCPVCSEIAGIATCAECAAGFVLQPGLADDRTRACLQCGVECATCSSVEDPDTGLAQCATCASGYILNSAASKCDGCPTFCAECRTTSSCTACMAGYYMVSGTCTPCISHLCAECDSEGTCLTCIERYGIKSEFPLSCDKCPENCDECTKYGTCTRCSPRYGLNSEGVCTGCASNCLECTLSGSTSVCDLCIELYKVNSADVCQACPSGCSDANCEYSTALSDVACTVCDIKLDQALDDSTGNCLDCPSQCAECTYNSTVPVFECLACDEYHGVDLAGDCVSCGGGCSNCIYNDTMAALSCVCIDRPAAGLHVPEVTSVAMSNLGQCDSGGATAYACDTGYYFDVSSLTCGDCTVTGCNVCDASSTACAVCKDGYAGPKSDGTCVECGTANCAQCSLNSGDESIVECDVCNDGYGLTTALECIACRDSHCLDCTYSGSDQECSQCETAYVIKSDDLDACASCPARCHTCLYNGGSPLCENAGCNDDNAYNDGLCYLCPGNCDECYYDSSSSSTKCTLCYPGYTTNSAELCEGCSDYCSDCTISGSVASCTEGACDSTYGVWTDGACADCQANCDICEYEASIETFECRECLATYVLNNDVCGACPEYCLSCEASTVTKGSMECLECEVGYIVSASFTCTPCGSTCITCTTTGCSECTTGYGLTADQKSCTVCSSLTGNAQCDTCEGGGSPRCLACVAGSVFSDDGTTCVSGGSGVCAQYQDRDWQCETCTEERVVMANGSCGYNCLVCPDGPSDTSDSCNVTTAAFPTEECYSGYCWGTSYYDSASKETLLTRGCNASALACSDETQQEGFCRRSEFSVMCEQCCLGDLCNSYPLNRASDMMAPLLFLTLVATVIAGYIARLALLNDLSL